MPDLDSSSMLPRRRLSEAKATRRRRSSSGVVSVDLNQWGITPQRNGCCKTAFKDGKYLVVFEPNDEPRQPTHTKAYERWMGLLFLVGVVGIVVVLSYVLDF